MKTSLKVFLYTFLLLLAWTNSQAQTTSQEFTSKNAIYLELLGNGRHYSLNYDRLLFQKNMIKVNARLGFNLTQVPHREPNRKYDPVALTEVTGMLGKTKHHLEVGLGYTYMNTVEVLDDWKYGNAIDNLIFSRIGYRFQKPQGGFLFRAGFTPTVFHATTNKFSNAQHFMPWGGLSFGWSF